MATTTIMSVHVNKGKTPKQCVSAQLNYIMNPAKTNGGKLISSHACMPETAVNEFMLYRQEYFENTGREIENEVLVYYVRQAFKPDEITPEEANEIGKELASRMTNDQFAYVFTDHACSLIIPRFVEKSFCLFDFSIILLFLLLHDPACLYLKPSAIWIYRCSSNAVASSSFQMNRKTYSSSSLLEANKKIQS